MTTTAPQPAIRKSELRWFQYGLAALLALAIPGSATPSSAYTYQQIGVASNFLIDEGKVYFVQADGSLTALELETGEVIARKQGHYEGSLRRVASGILVLGGEISLLDKTTLEPIWKTSHRYCPTIIDDRLISCDGHGHVEYRSLATGEVLWSYSLPGALEITVKKGRVLVFHSATFEGPEVAPAIVLLDLQTGREVLHRTTPPGVHYLAAYFDGDKIYLPAGKYTGSFTPGTSGYDEGRASAGFEELLVWDLNGNPVESFPASANLHKNCLSDSDGFVLAGKVFARGEVWRSMEAVPPHRPGTGKLVPQTAAGDCAQNSATTRFGLTNGTLSITATIDAVMRYDVAMRLDSGEQKWTGTLPYLNDRAEVVVVGSTQDRILLGSNLGHVECINADSGRSLWMYVFPTQRWTMSCSSRGMPPYMATAAAIYRHENTNRKIESGMILAGDVKRPVPRIVLDPVPADPYRDLPFYTAIAWTGALFLLVFSGLLFLGRGKRQWDIRLCAGLSFVLTLLAVACLALYGRVSISSSIALRVSILACLLGTLVYSVICVQEEYQIFGVAFLVLSIGIGVIVFPAFLSL